MKTSIKTRPATKEDFAIGTKLIQPDGVNEWEWILTKVCDWNTDIWEAKSDSGTKVIFANEARFYKIVIA